MAFPLKAEESVPLCWPPSCENVDTTCFDKLITDTRRVKEDTIQLGIYRGLGKAGHKFQKGWSSLGKQLPESSGQSSFND